MRSSAGCSVPGAWCFVPVPVPVPVQVRVLVPVLVLVLVRVPVLARIAMQNGAEHSIGCDHRRRHLSFGADKWGEKCWRCACTTQSSMGVRRFQDLDAWKLANEIRIRVIALTEKPEVKQRFKYRDQLDDASSSACRNIAEGFGRYRHRQFAQLVRVARASEGEMLDLLIEARQRGFVTPQELKDYEDLIERAMKAAAGLIRYLENTPD